MGFMDDMKKKADDVTDDVKGAANDAENKFHEKKGEMQGRADQADADNQDEDAESDND